MNAAMTSLLMLMWVGGPSGANSDEGRLAVIQHCQVYLTQDVELSAEEAGRLVEVAVQEGDAVVQGQLLVRINDRQSQLNKLAAEIERAAAQARADDDIEVRYAKKSYEVAAAELERSERTNRKSAGTVPESELHRQQLEKHRAFLQIDRSQLEQRVARLNADVQEAAVQLAEENILRRRIEAPFDGVVINVFREVNEWVNAGETVLRVVRLEQLQVDGFLNASEFDPSDVLNCRATVDVALARGRRESFQGRVSFVNPLVQAGDRYRVRAVVDNRKENGHWLMRPGMSAVVHILARSAP